jgi:ankyrin repeat protein
MSDWDRLLSACQNNDSYLVFRLVFDEGVSPSHSNKFGQSALHIAALWVHGRKAFCGQNFLENCHQHRTRPELAHQMKFVYTVLIKS